MRESPEYFNFVNRQGTIYLQTEYAWIKLKETVDPEYKIKSWKIHENDTITLFLFKHHKILQS